MAGIGIAKRGLGLLKKFEKKADKISEKMIKEMNSKKLIEKAKGYSKLVGGTLAASAAMPSSIEKDQRVRKATGGRAENPIARNKKNYRSTKSGAGMTQAGVAAYRRANPGSKLKTAVTGKVKAGSKSAKRRKSYCARSLGQLKRSSAKTRNDPNSRIRQARRRWKC